MRFGVGGSVMSRCDPAKAQVYPTVSQAVIAAKEGVDAAGQVEGPPKKLMLGLGDTKCAGFKRLWKRVTVAFVLYTFWPRQRGAESGGKTTRWLTCYASSEHHSRNMVWTFGMLRWTRVASGSNRGGVSHQGGIIPAPPHARGQSPDINRSNLRLP